jgi:hypothetical protein
MSIHMRIQMLQGKPPWEWPEDADKILLAILNDPGADRQDLMLAAEFAGDYVVVNNELSEALLGIVGNEQADIELRGRAAISLGVPLEHADTMGFDDPDDILISKELFHRIQHTLRHLYEDPGTPDGLSRKILEASVRAPQNWHRDAVRAAYSRGDQLWKQTAVFCMRYIRGFDEQILESLDSGHATTHYQAVCAAGVWQIDRAWPHITNLIQSDQTEKTLLLAAIESAAGIRPQQAAEVLADFIDSKDEDIAEAVYEALSMAEMLEAYESDEDFEDDQENQDDQDEEDEDVFDDDQRR